MRVLQLELRKLNWWPYLLSSLGLTLFLLSMMYMIAVSAPMIPTELPGAPQLNTLSDLFMIITIMASACFAIFASLLSSKIVIEAYQDKQAQLLFAYPVTRRAMIGIKLGVVSGVSFLATALSLLICLSLFMLSERIAPFYGGSTVTISNVLQQVVLSSTLAVTICLIATSVAFKKKSIQVTMIAAIALAALFANLLQVNNRYLTIGLLLLLVIGGIVAVFKMVRNVTEMEVG